MPWASMKGLGHFRLNLLRIKNILAHELSSIQNADDDQRSGLLKIFDRMH